jgi:hypothetical protein
MCRFKVTPMSFCAVLCCQVYALLMRVPGIGIAKENNTGEQWMAAWRAYLRGRWSKALFHRIPSQESSIAASPTCSCYYQILQPSSSHQPGNCPCRDQPCYALPLLCCVCLQLHTLSPTWCSWLVCSALLQSLVSHCANSNSTLEVRTSPDDFVGAAAN